MKVYGFHEGDRSEYLAQFAFSTVGHCIAVPRQADYFLTDLIVHLFSRDQGALSVTGLDFGIQIKSGTNDIPVNGKDARLCFFRTLRPFLLGVVEKRTGMLSVYTTMHRLRLAWTGLERDLTLTFAGDGSLNVPHKVGESQFPIGKPIACVCLDDLDHREDKRRMETRQTLSTMLMSWVEFETVAIICRRLHLPWILLPLGYETNVLYPAKDLYAVPVLDRGALAHATTSIITSLTAFRVYAEACFVGKTLSDGETAELSALTRALSETEKMVSTLRECP